MAYILLMAWNILFLTPNALKSLQFMAVFPSERVFSEAMHRVPLSFASGLMQVFTSATAPTIAYFKTLPLHLEKQWAVYLLVLEKDMQRPRVYIGSGTKAEGGVKSRMQAYDLRVLTGKNNDSIPYYIHKSLEEGITITHKGLLVWTPIPRPAFQYLIRTLFLVLECAFTLLLWAIKSRTKDYFMPALCRWPRESFTYDGLCTHFSINEGLAADSESSNLTPEEFDALALERKKEKNRQHIARKGEEVHRANSKAYGDKALAEERFMCDVCVIAFRSNAKLQYHLETAECIRKHRGDTKVLKGRGGSQCNIAKKKFSCAPCKHNAPSAKRLETHLNGPRHAKKLRLLAQRAERA